MRTSLYFIKQVVALFSLCLIGVSFSFTPSDLSHDTIRIGSKRFTESYILGEILNELALKTGEATVDYRPGLGNTGITYIALKDHLIDIYPEYTGTILHEILHLPYNQPLSTQQFNQMLEPLGLAVTPPLGFNNSYALAMSEVRANELGIRQLSDLIHHSTLRLGFSQEFLGRADGWPGLQKKLLGFTPQSVIGIDHALSYEAIAHDQIDVIDIYTTDPKIAVYKLRILEDDLHFFPVYNAVLFYRLESALKFKHTWDAFHRLVDTIPTTTMINLNALTEINGLTFQQTAQSFLNQTESFKQTPPSFLSRLFHPDLWQLTQQHLFLVFASLIPATLIGIPLGIMTSYSHLLRHLVLNTVGIIQTIPALALLAFLIPLFRQIGTIPALAALFLYALLPIVRNTYAGMTSIAKPLQQSALALGLPFMPRLIKIELPLASRTILAGIKTAAVMNVGMATIAAFIGAGGYGERIVAGLALNDYGLLLAGAIPACFLAILVQTSFDWLDYYLIPKGIQ